jgi:hypothetical protein
LQISNTNAAWLGRLAQPAQASSFSPTPQSALAMEQTAGAAAKNAGQSPAPIASTPVQLSSSVLAALMAAQQEDAHAGAATGAGAPTDPSTQAPPNSGAAPSTFTSQLFQATTGDSLTPVSGGGDTFAFTMRDSAGRIVDPIQNGAISPQAALASNLTLAQTGTGDATISASGLAAMFGQMSSQGTVLPSDWLTKGQSWLNSQAAAA